MFETHVREEYSTFAWILEGMIARAGLTVTASHNEGGIGSQPPPNCVSPMFTNFVPFQSTARSE